MVRVQALALASTVGCRTLDCPCRFDGLRLGAEEVMDTHPTVCRASALSEVRRHSADEGEFLSEVGDREEYDGAAVLAWLGY